MAIEYVPPKGVSEEAKDFIERLLVKDPSERLGFKSINEIKKHKVFQVR